jgi:hypothetical protein
VECVACERSRKEEEEEYEVVVSRVVDEHVTITASGTTKEEAGEKAKAALDNVPASECSGQVRSKSVDHIEKK